MYNYFSRMMSLIIILNVFGCVPEEDLSYNNIDKSQKKVFSISDLDSITMQMDVTNSDFSGFLESEDTLCFVVESLRSTGTPDSLFYNSINNLVLKLYLHHLRNGCSGYNISNQDNQLASWMINLSKTQFEDKSEFREITHSGFVYHGIQDSIIYSYDAELLNDISRREDSCLNYDSITYPSDFRP